MIAFEGLDQSGKKTQANILKSKLVRRGVEARNITFPDYSTPMGKEIRRFLSGSRAIGPRLRQVLYAANRWERVEDIATWLREGYAVVADRYVGSGLAYGIANGLDLEWMASLEDGLPEPDVVILLDISVAESIRRKEQKRDVYERDEALLKEVRRAYLYLAKRFGWRVIPAGDTVEAVSEKVWTIVEPYVEKKLRSDPSAK